MKPLILFYDGPCVLCNYWIRKLCHWDKKDQLRFTSLDSSSCTVYGQAQELPITEETPLKPSSSPYGFTKQMGEQIIENLKNLEAIRTAHMQNSGSLPRWNFKGMAYALIAAFKASISVLLMCIVLKI